MRYPCESCNTLRAGCLGKRALKERASLERSFIFPPSLSHVSVVWRSRVTRYDMPQMESSFRRLLASKLLASSGTESQTSLCLDSAVQPLCKFKGVPPRVSKPRMLITTCTEVSIKLVTEFSLITSKLIKFLGVFAYVPLGRNLFSFKLKVGRKNIHDQTT